MPAAIFAYSAQGCETARRVCRFLADRAPQCFAPARLAQAGFSPIPKPSRDFYCQAFASCELLVFVGSCGIAVREIAPFVRDKRSDPAVLVIDETGIFVIALLSGHIGGANDLARSLADALGATPVITTATDVNGRFSVDAWATKRGYVIGSMPLAKAVSAVILERDVPLWSDAPIVGSLPAGVVPGERGALGIYVGVEHKTPFEKTLQIVPKCLHLGIGCRKDTPVAAIAAAVDAVLDRAGLDPRAVAAVCSIDLKAGEPGLLEFCKTRNWPLRCYDAETLTAVAGEFTPSSFVTSVTGVDNVCERAAMVGAEQLLVRKTAQNGVTVAVAAEKVEVCFG